MASKGWKEHCLFKAQQMKCIADGYKYEVSAEAVNPYATDAERQTRTQAALAYADKYAKIAAEYEKMAAQE